MPGQGATGTPIGEPVWVHLVRHGETIGYETDAGLTERGRMQARTKADVLAGTLEGAGRIAVVHSPRARAEETARVVTEVLRRRLEPGGTRFTEPAVDDGFDNFHIWSDGAEDEVTAAFSRYAGHRGDDPDRAAGWIVEADRFWALHQSGGDPIGHWLAQPLQHFEPPVLVVRRFWSAVIRVASAGLGDHVVVATHSGPIRAVAAQVLGGDPGEPDHLEVLELGIVPGADTSHFRFRGVTLEVGIPVLVRPSWFEPGRVS